MRLFGSFLTWMQEKDCLAFVVATANNISKLPPELLRKGRFDEIFYVDLPNKDERKKIFEIHIRRRRAEDLDDIDIETLVNNTEGYCGADIEGVVKEAIEKAFVKKQDSVTTGNILDVIMNTSALSVTMGESIREMKKTFSEKKLKPASRELSKVLQRE